MSTQLTPKQAKELTKIQEEFKNRIVNFVRKQGLPSSSLTPISNDIAYCFKSITSRLDK